MTLRKILAVTTAICIAAPVAVSAQSDTRDEVREILGAYGYDASQVDMLTDEQVAEIYLESTSENQSDIAAMLSGMDLMEDDDMGTTVAVTAGESDNIDAVVADRMMAMGYTQEQIDSLDDTDMTEIYLAITSEDQNDIRTTIEGALAS